MSAVLEETPCASGESVKCQFGHEELVELHMLASRQQYVAFPKWAMGLLITILIALVSSNGAIWIALSDKATRHDLQLARDDLATQLILARERLVKLESVVPTDFPPKWFEKQFNDLVNQTNENGKLLTELRIEVRSLSAERTKEGGKPNG